MATCYLLPGGCQGLTQQAQDVRPSPSLGPQRKRQQDAQLFAHSSACCDSSWVSLHQLGRCRGGPFAVGGGSQVGDGVVRAGWGPGRGAVGVPVVAGEVGGRPDQGATIGSNVRTGRVRDWCAVGGGADAVLPSCVDGGDCGGLACPRQSGWHGSPVRRGSVVRRHRVSAAKGRRRAPGDRSGPGYGHSRGLRRPGHVDDLRTAASTTSRPARASHRRAPRSGGQLLLARAGRSTRPSAAANGHTRDPPNRRQHRTRRQHLQRTQARAPGAVARYRPGQPPAGDGRRSTAAIDAALRPTEHGPVSPACPLRSPRRSSVTPVGPRVLGAHRVELGRQPGLMAHHRSFVSRDVSPARSVAGAPSDAPKRQKRARLFAFL